VFYARKHFLNTMLASMNLKIMEPELKVQYKKTVIHADVPFIVQWK